jgi:hypothetical protein
MEPVGGGAHDYHIGGLIYGIQPCNLGRVGIAHDSDTVGFYPEAGVPVPFDLMPYYPLSTLAKLSRDLENIPALLEDTLPTLLDAFRKYKT